VTALLHALANLARLRWLGAAFCALAMLCATTHATALAGATAHARVNVNASSDIATTTSTSAHAQTKDRVWGFDQNSPLHVCALRSASAEQHPGFLPTQRETASGPSYAAEGGVTTLEASAIRFSQSSVNGVESIANSMRASGWVGAPIDVVSVEGQLITVDNTRVLAAYLTETPVQAMIHSAGEALPAAMTGRFGAAITWGEAVMTRIAGQNAAYQTAYPLGSWFIGVTP
jgi:hypothetical protein